MCRLSRHNAQTTKPHFPVYALTKFGQYSEAKYFASYKLAIIYHLFELNFRNLDITAFLTHR